MILCGAWSRQAQRPCRQHVVPGRNRCHWHGGRNPGGRPGNRNALLHGRYTAAALAAKLVSRATKAGLPTELAARPARADGQGDGGDRLFALVAELKLAGADPEQLLREAARGFAADVRAAEAAARAEGLDSHGLTAAAWLRFWPRGAAADLPRNDGAPGSR